MEFFFPIFLTMCGFIAVMFALGLYFVLRQNIADPENTNGGENTPFARMFDYLEEAGDDVECRSRELFALEFSKQLMHPYAMDAVTSIRDRMDEHQTLFGNMAEFVDSLGDMNERLGELELLRQKMEEDRDAAHEDPIDVAFDDARRSSGNPPGRNSSRV